MTWRSNWICRLLKIKLGTLSRWLWGPLLLSALTHFHQRLYYEVRSLTFVFTASLHYSYLHRFLAVNFSLSKERRNLSPFIGLCFKSRFSNRIYSLLKAAVGRPFVRLFYSIDYHFFIDSHDCYKFVVLKSCRPKELFVRSAWSGSCSFVLHAAGWPGHAFPKSRTQRLSPTHSGYINQ